MGTPTSDGAVLQEHDTTQTYGEVPESWVSIGSGAFVSKGDWELVCTWVADGPAPETLCVGDIIECTAASNGRFLIAVNDKVVADWPAQFPDRVSMYPLVGVSGRVWTVQL